MSMGHLPRRAAWGSESPLSPLGGGATLPLIKKKRPCLGLIKLLAWWTGPTESWLRHFLINLAFIESGGLVLMLFSRRKWGRASLAQW